MKNKSLLIIAPTILIMGSIIGCKNGGDTPTPTPEKTLKSIKVTPTMDTYTVGYKFTDFDIGSFQAYYSDGSTVPVKEGYTSDPALPYEFKETDVTKGKDFTFTYQGKSDSFNVKVIKPKVLDSIEAKCDKSFTVNSVINKSDITVTAKYDDQSTKVITDWSCDDFKNDTYTFVEGDKPSKTFAITYKNKQTNLTVTVGEDKSLNKTKFLAKFNEYKKNFNDAITEYEVSQVISASCLGGYDASNLAVSYNGREAFISGKVSSKNFNVRFDSNVITDAQLNTLQEGNYYNYDADGKTIQYINHSCEVGQVKLLVVNEYGYVNMLEVNGETSEAQNFFRVSFKDKEVPQEPLYLSYCQYNPIAETNNVTVSHKYMAEFPEGRTLKIPSTIDGEYVNEGVKGTKYTVTEISAYAFCYSDILNINLPSSIKLIDYWAFFSANKLTSVILNEGLEEIGSEAFTHCTALSGILLPDTLKRINGGAFGSTNITTITIPGNVEFIGSNAFVNTLSSATFFDTTTAWTYTSKNPEDWVPSSDAAANAATLVQKSSSEFKKKDPTKVSLAFDGSGYYSESSTITSRKHVFEIVIDDNPEENPAWPYGVDQFVLISGGNNVHLYSREVYYKANGSEEETKLTEGTDYLYENGVITFTKQYKTVGDTLTFKVNISGTYENARAIAGEISK